MNLASPASLSPVTSVRTGERLSPWIAALGSLGTPVDGKVEHMALPVDLYMLTAHFAHDGGQLEIAVTALRTRAERFRSRAAGQLAFALLKPRGMMLLTGLPLRGRTDCRLSLEEFCPTDEREQLRGSLMRCAGDQARVERFAQWMEHRLERRRALGVQQSRVASAAEWLHHRSSGPVHWPSLCDGIGTSRRQLERDFDYWLGISPAGFDRLVRFQRAAQAMVTGERLVDAAHGHHFYDQPHLTRTCKTLTSLTPRQLAAAATRPQRRLEQQALCGRILVVDSRPPIRGALPGMNS
jgi:AraC-like DNA-binding protein